MLAVYDLWAFVSENWRELLDGLIPGADRDIIRPLHKRIEKRYEAILLKIKVTRIEAVPEGFILMLNNRDVPGVVGSVGMLLGEAKINIAGLQLGREQVGGMALSLVHVDERIPLEVLERLRKLPNIVSAEMLEL